MAVRKASRPKDGIIRRDDGVRSRGDFGAVGAEVSEIVLAQSHETQIDEKQFHGSVAYAFAEG